MRREMTLRRRLLPIFILATGIPIVLFALISQYRLRSSLNENMQMQIDNNLNRADQSLDMILDKYDTLLYDLCTDDEIIGIVEDINQKKDTLEVNSLQMARNPEEAWMVSFKNAGRRQLSINPYSGEINVF